MTSRVGRLRGARAPAPRRAGAFALAALVCLAATVIPLRIALRKMEEFEF
jgi:hypothetical protein